MEMYWLDFGLTWVERQSSKPLAVRPIRCYTLMVVVCGHGRVQFIFGGYRCRATRYVCTYVHAGGCQVRTCEGLRTLHGGVLPHVAGVCPARRA